MQAGESVLTLRMTPCGQGRFCPSKWSLGKGMSSTATTLGPLNTTPLFVAIF